MTSTEPAPPVPPDRTTAWARDVHEGRVVAGPYIRAAAARHLQDLKEGPKRGLVWDLDAADRAMRFFERRLRLNGGQFEGRRFRLHPSQAFRIGSLFGWKWKATGLRRFRRFYDEEAKGNGKSPLLAGIGLYMLCADGEARAEIYAAAAKKDQAMVMFRDAVAMRDQSPALVSRISTSGENPVWQLTYRASGGDARFFKPISSEKSQSGPRPHCALCDEVHEHPSRDVIDLLERGFKFRKQPLLVMATNAGTSRTSICWEEHRHAVDVVTGVKEDDTTFAFVCSLDEGDDWERDPSCWVKANPLLGTTIDEAYLAGVVEQARLIPGKRNGIARLHFCEWTQAETAAIARETWVACRAPDPFDEGRLAELPCFGGLDLSQTRDFTALSLVWVAQGARDTLELLARSWFWTPGDTLDARAVNDEQPYRLWADQGHIEAVPGERLKYDWLADAIGEIAARYAPIEVGCDQYGLERLREHLTGKGIHLPAVIHPQGFQKRVLDKDQDASDGEQEIYLWMPDSITKLEELLIDRRIRIQHNPLLDSMAASVVYASNRTGARMFDKHKAYGRIDGMVALAMAVGMATCRERAADDLDGFVSAPLVIAR